VITLINGLFPGINVLIPQAAGIAVGLIWNFLLYNKVVFRQRRGVTHE
jgi:putative flippase GtrA